MLKVTTPKFRASFVNVFEARDNMQGKPTYSLSMLFPKTADLSVLKNLVEEAATLKWGKKILAGIRTPFRNGDEKEYEGYEGMIYCSASSKSRPGIVDSNLQPIIDPSEFYSGCYARATITAYAYGTLGNNGVAFGLHNIQKISDGDPLGGRARPEADFKTLAEDVNSKDLFGDVG